MDDAGQKISLQVKDICAIIKSCRNCGVTKFKFGDLEVDFGRPALSPHGKCGEAVNHLSVAEITDEIHEKQMKEALEQDELRLKDEQVAQALIENPLLAEQLIMDGELEDDSEPDFGDESD
jgi:predicted  nucleic acid-binding Zn-ribbon protein